MRDFAVRIGKFSITREPPEKLCPYPAWVFLDSSGPWLIVSHSLPSLLWLIVKEWRNDKNLVGW